MHGDPLVRACGSHFAHSQNGRSASDTQNPTIASSGAWNAAYWATIDRTRLRDGSSDPRPAPDQR